MKSFSRVLFHASDFGDRIYYDYKTRRAYMVSNESYERIRITEPSHLAVIRKAADAWLAKTNTE